MAFLDNNNDDLYAKSDPLEELDRELAELKRTLGALEGDTAEPQPDKSDEPAASRPGPEPLIKKDSFDRTAADTPAPEKTAGETERRKKPIEPESPEPNEEPDDEPEEEPQRVHARPTRTPVRKKKTHRLPIIIAVLLLIAGLVLIAGYAAKRYLPFFGTAASDKLSDDEKTVTIKDSEMGSFEFTPVEGAETNAYTKEGLVTDENGVPSYYENDQKISHLGVDISEFQGDVDFQALKDAGAEFVMLRIGGRFYGDKSSIYQDDAFDTYYEQANAAGLKVGAYFFSQAISAEDAREEANFAITKLDGKALSYPIAFDWENIADDEARTDNVTGDQLTAIAEAFCDTIDAAGYRSIVYSNTSQMFIMYDFETMKDYDFWLADYREFPTMYYKFDMWQYTKEGTIDGIEGTVDLNLSFTDFS